MSNSNLNFNLKSNSERIHMYLHIAELISPKL